MLVEVGNQFDTWSTVSLCTQRWWYWCQWISGKWFNFEVVSRELWFFSDWSLDTFKETVAITSALNISFGDTSPNCCIKVERDNQKWKKEWEEASVKWEITNLIIDEVKKKSLGAHYRWDGVPAIPNSAWNSPKECPEVINLTSPLPPPSLFPPTPPSSPPL